MTKYMAILFLALCSNLSSVPIEFELGSKVSTEMQNIINAIKVGNKSGIEAYIKEGHDINANYYLPLVFAIEEKK